MTEEQYQLLEKRHLRLLQFVGKMRKYQRDWFAHHSSSDLKLAKRYESEVDKVLKEEKKDLQSGQASLF